ncbi:Transforming acidic coiled-coil-containing protein 3 [Galemys pyrenaicus]|uniref:Transforming acidic coiled-coil-containing protein 3 n=1 Tax=Galemys pyrenaicus TaxID=202257 RepID=A0A8J5ZVQ9_GALPY|nr:Transforming acidic coiled-coil-containing protein 3 [Galemys pyrenaicus]
MSLQSLNDENVGGDRSKESCDFLFSSPELTGRSSVLRPSQKENVLPKTTGRATKVTFQTPLRDPQTHQIVSPNLSSRLEASFTLDDTTGVENTDPGWTQKENQQFAKEADAKATNGILQKPLVTDADLLFGDVSPTSKDWQPCGSLSATADPSGSPQAPGDLESQETSPGLMSVCPGKALAGRACFSTEESAISDVLDTPGVTSQERMGDSPRAEGESAQGSPVSSAGAAAPAGAGPEAVCGEALLARPPGQDPSSLNDTATHPLRPAQAASPGPQKEADSSQTAACPGGAPVRLELGFSDKAATRRPPPPRALGKRPEARQGEACGPAPPAQDPCHLNQDKLDGPNLCQLGSGTEAQSPEHPPSSLAGPAAPEDMPPSRQVLAAPEEGTAAVQTPAGTTDMKGEAGEVRPPHPSCMRCSSILQEGSPHSQVQSLPPQPLCSLSEEHFRDPAEEVTVGTGWACSPVLRVKKATGCPRPGLSCAGRHLPCTGVSGSGASLHRGPLWGHQPVLSIRGLGFQVGLPLAPKGLLGTGAEVDYLEQFGASSSVPVLPPPCVLGPIVDLLQYSQKDLDTAVEAAQRESLLLKSRCEELQAKNLEMGKIMEGFEGIVYQAMEEAQKQKELSKAEIQKALREKEQLAADLRSVEKSFSELFKRFEKQKEVIEGYRTDARQLVRFLASPVWARLAGSSQQRLAHSAPCQDTDPGLHTSCNRGQTLSEVGGTATGLGSLADSWTRGQLGQGCGFPKRAGDGDVAGDPGGQVPGCSASRAEGTSRLGGSTFLTPPKNEASLKKCVEDYIARIEKEGQRYQALKAHAEEKLRLANEEIAQVRSKAQAEASAFQAGLRREQMRVHSLEKTVEQKTKENEELTRICDDLISKMERI